MSEPAPLHRSAEIEDLTHITVEDKKKIEEEAEKGPGSLQKNDENSKSIDSSLKDIPKA